MATVVLDPGTVTHTLADTIFGVYIANFFHLDYTSASFQALYAPLGVESCRTNSNYVQINHASYDSYKAFLASSGGHTPHVVLGIPLAPNQIPSVNSNPTIAGDVAVSGSQYSPAEAAAVYTSWVNAGINVAGVEVGNEPSFRGVVQGSEPVFPPTNPDVPWAIDWHNTHHKFYATALRAAATALGRTVKISGPSSAGIRPDAYLYIRSYIDGTLRKGIGTGQANAAYTDALSLHPYGSKVGGTTPQSQFNSIFYVGDPTNWNTNQSFQNMTQVRAYMNANGMGSIPIWMTEYSIAAEANPVNYTSCTGDAAGAIGVCNGNLPASFGGPAWNVQCIHYQAYNRGVSTAEGNFFFGDPASPNHRYYFLRDILGPFLRTYKRQVQQTLTGSGNTPGDVGNPAVGRIRCAAGLNSDGSRLGVLVANISLAASESVTVSYGTLALGQVTGVSLPQNAAASPMPSVAPFSATTSFTSTIGPGEVYLFVIPISGGPAPPPPSAEPNTGNWSSAIQFNAAAEGPAPPPPDQNLGNWSEAIQINASLPSVTGPPVPGGASGIRHGRDVEWGGTGGDDTAPAERDPDAVPPGRDSAWRGGGDA